MAKKSIVEEALLEAKQLEEALKKNSKEILAATMKQDIDEMVKASLFEGDESAEETEELEEESQMETSEDESSTMVMDEQTEETDEQSEETDEQSEETGEESEESEEESGEDVEDMEMDLSTEEPETEETEDTEVIDMTNASNEKLFTVFKKMDDNDEIEVVKTGNDVNLKDKKTGAEYMIKMDESMSYDDEDETMSYDDEDESMSYDDEDETMSYDEMRKYMEDNEDESMSYEDEDESMMSHADEDESSCDECGWSEDENQEPIYEITFDDDDDDEEDIEMLRHIEKMPKPKHVDSDYEDSDDDDLPEAPEDTDPFAVGGHDEGTRRTMADRRKVAMHPQNYPSSRMDESVKSEYKKVIKEYKELKDKYSQTKDALKVFREKLGEIALFNSNLTHAVKLFMEHATTKTEKTAIMKRFDEEAVTLKESKRLYKTITNELKDRKPISEKVEKKINESLTKGSSDTLIESKVYVDPQISKIHDLMDKLDNRK